MVRRHQVDERVVYQIKVQGNLDGRWSDWFSGLIVTIEDEGENPPVSTLTGSLDQAALRGILNKIWDLNLDLISVVPIEGTVRGGGR
jgi:hypothetical protein